MKHRYSIQRELSRWIMLSALVLVLIAGIASGGVAFFEARELQDNLLREISKLVIKDQLNDSPSQRHQDHEEETIIIQTLNRQSRMATPRIPYDIPDGLQTLKLEDEKWRVLALTKSSSGERLAIAQQTELRDSIAWASSMNVFFPILLLVVFMLLLIHFIIRIRLKPLKKLTSQLDQLDGTQLAPLPETAIPEEIAPFILSINALLTRTQQAMQKQQRFIADAAHELRTPVTALSLLAENVEQAPTEVDRQARQKLLQQGLTRLRMLVSQLLDLARLQSDHESPTEAVPLERIVQDAIADLHPLAEAKQIDLGMLCKESMTVMNQDGRLSQLIRNAIDNAIRYTPTGGKVDVSLFAEAGKAVFCVEDNGIGIPEHELDQIMEPFHRAQGNAEPGNGLGLAISQEIAQRLGGIITLSNRPEGGVKFQYTQPIL